MNYETFRKEKDRIAELSEQEQKEFYINVLEKETLASNTRLEAYFEYASLVFYEGDFVRREKFSNHLPLPIKAMSTHRS